MNVNLPADYAIVLQARSGSTRLPGKMTLPFYGGKNMLEIIVSTVKEKFDAGKIILATTTSEKDDELAEIAARLGIALFRGSENDVLQRFIDCAEEYKLNHCIRICADNPFIQAAYIEELVRDYMSFPCDYSSFAFPDGTPIIRSHIGFFTEMVRVEALRRAANLTQESFYHEHVTNFIYGNKDLFDVRLLPMPLHLQKRTDIRLTIDTADDFDMAAALFGELSDRGETQNTTAILEAIDRHPEFRERMSALIKQFSK